MPTVEAPKQQVPMEAAAEATAPGQIITRQPKSEPLPQLENEASLRGGGMNVGCTCCDGTCSFHRYCC
ncbi:hypothetical protein B0T26DRAFT_755329 [Lasiosphaeria miniovina]|uniref:Uncharacterized protein n=1 Tax=Lasiosphaeria miniovina TaxID=1954250 RepID=A0AA40DNI3_9PEZI|nr:uncharacterized protein B0T26DRAFT_755329 [Lasiosphaeria miniovina]KAK0710239.1 hypothetical protein B0T26DRAFT_755329 [Lasiosphaeria miniovina]